MDISLFLSPKGRIARGPFWIGILVLFVLNMLLSAIPIVGGAAGLVLLWPQIVLYVKRLHDFGWSGWLWLLPFCVSAGCVVFMVLSGGAALGTATTPEQLQALILSPAMRTPLIALEVALAVGLVFLFWVGLTKGAAQANRFGPVPGARARDL
jgi:uncharacterized membrane protein YhaH (DUF805 family)